jgi:hypothetical protein
MSYAFPPEIQHLVEQNLATGKYSTENEVLQAALLALSDYHATIADVRQGMVDYEQGLGEPLAGAVAEVRRQLGSQP